ncbi:photosystem I reaction center subunit PsaK [Cyanobacterium stanieri PCC 7202]|uniref:Photosystem I reaction center subunit PsaK n=1 Tax=Cyanobacterium stanieri (strain ATCC 29140 / PCC 7202) TaxID=292563 RepID=K9YN15_CYASC|nr:photosystem I reaction center subunit PsaK [Cyanobacterium stanieri PCC 7202]
MFQFTSIIATAIPTTIEWSPNVAFTMIVCNIVAIAIGKFTIKYPSEGPQLPSPNLFGGMGFPALLATTSLGHLIGAGVILGLSNLGAL